MLLYEKSDEREQCKAIVLEQFKKAGIDLAEDDLNNYTIEIMNISEAHGGDFSNDVIQEFARGYITCFLMHNKLPGEREEDRTKCKLMIKEEMDKNNRMIDPDEVERIAHVILDKIFWEKGPDYTDENIRNYTKEVISNKS